MLGVVGVSARVCVVRFLPFVRMMYDMRLIVPLLLLLYCGFLRSRASTQTIVLVVVLTPAPINKQKGSNGRVTQSALAPGLAPHLEEASDYRGACRTRASQLTLAEASQTQPRARWEMPSGGTRSTAGGSQLACELTLEP